MPSAVIIENPDTGILKDLPVLKGWHRGVTSYCHYGFDRVKPTSLWTSFRADIRPRLLWTCSHAPDANQVARMSHPTSIRARSCTRFLPDWSTLCLAKHVGQLVVFRGVLQVLLHNRK